MKKKYSIKKNEDIQTLLNTGQLLKNRELIIYIKENGTRENKVAFLVGKKLGNAPLRNKMKRRLRVAMQAIWPKLNQGFDIVIIARPFAIDKKPEMLIKSLEYLLKKHKMVMIQTKG